MSLRRVALVLAVVALVVVSVLGVVGVVFERHEAPASIDQDPGREAPGSGPRRADTPVSTQGWVRVSVGPTSYAVPRTWQRRPATERSAYREEGAVIASGRGQALLTVGGCPVAWSVIADPVRARNVAGVAEATALAWARGYAGLPVASRLTAEVDGASARVEVRLDQGGCAGAGAELTAVAVPVGETVVALVVARYLGVPGAPGDAAYDGVLRSLRTT